MHMLGKQKTRMFKLACKYYKPTNYNKMKLANDLDQINKINKECKLNWIDKQIEIDSKMIIKYKEKEINKMNLLGDNKACCLVCCKFISKNTIKYHKQGERHKNKEKRIKENEIAKNTRQLKEIIRNEMHKRNKNKRQDDDKFILCEICMKGFGNINQFMKHFMQKRHVKCLNLLEIDDAKKYVGVFEKTAILKTTKKKQTEQE